MSQPSPKRIAMPVLQEVLRLYREQYFDFNVRHFHEKLVEQNNIQLSYTWVKTALQIAGLGLNRTAEILDATPLRQKENRRDPAHF